MKIQISLSSHKYRYAMVNRPVGYAHCPQDGLIGSEDRPPSGKDHHDVARNGVAVYDRKLTDHETKQFEMAFMADGEDRKELAKLVAKELHDYDGDAYIQDAEENPNDFRSTVGDQLKTVGKGYRPSVGNIDSFAKQVLEYLKAMK